MISSFPFDVNNNEALIVIQTLMRLAAAFEDRLDEKRD